MKRFMMGSILVGLALGTLAAAGIVDAERDALVERMLSGHEDGTAIQCYVDDTIIHAPSIYDLGKMRSSPLRERFVADHLVWLNRWRTQVYTFTKMADHVYVAEATSAYIYVTGDRSWQWMLDYSCQQIANGWPGELTPYQQYATNPEPLVIALARVADMNEWARMILWDAMEDCLTQLHDGAHGWDNYGKSSLCRVRLQQAMRLPCDPYHDYGANRGVGWMLTYVDDCGWLMWMTGSPWYQIYNDAITPLAMPIWERLTEAEQRKVANVYFFAWRWQCGGVSPVVGEDADKGRVGSVRLWLSFARHWTCNDAVSMHCAWEITHRSDYTMNTEDLLIPLPSAKPATPKQETFSDFGKWGSILRTKSRETYHYEGGGPVFDYSHVGRRIPAHGTKVLP